jgi:hypothetical protein
MASARSLRFLRMPRGAPAGVKEVGKGDLRQQLQLCVPGPHVGIAPVTNHLACFDCYPQVRYRLCVWACTSSSALPTACGSTMNLGIRQELPSEASNPAHQQFLEASFEASL